jgi:hypothetical protein
MNHLRKGRRSDPATVISEPGSVRFPESSLLARDLQRPSQDTPKKVMSDCQSHIKRSRSSSHHRDVNDRHIPEFMISLATYRRVRLCTIVLAWTLWICALLAKSWVVFIAAFVPYLLWNQVRHAEERGAGLTGEPFGSANQSVEATADPPRRRL